MFTRGSSIDLGLNRAVESLLRSGGSEGILPIVQVGEPVLRQPTRRYNGQLSKSTLTKLVETMRTTMVEAPGVGLAAPQIGLGLALAVVEDHISDDLDDPREIATVLAERTHSEVVQVIGKKIVLYKENKDHKKIELPR